MKYLRHLIAFNLTVFFTCCSNQPKEELEIKYEDICVPINGNELSLYQIGSVNTNNDSTIFYGYNHFQQKFDLFDLTNRRFLKSINIEADGPNGISNIETFGIIDNRLLIKENFRLVTLSKDSLIIFELEPNSSYQLENGFDFDKFTIISSLFDGIDFDAKENMFFPVMSPDNEFPFAFVDMNNKIVGLLPFENPIGQNIILYGDKIYPSIEIGANDLLVINYNFSSRIFIYDKKTNQTSSINIKSDFTDNETIPLTKEKLKDISTRVNYHLNELNFYGMRYDRFRNIYLRVHQDKRETSKDNQVLYLSIISKDFKKLKEIKLPSTLKPYFEIGFEGIYFPIEPNDETAICFKLLKID